MNWQPIETAPLYDFGAAENAEVLVCNRDTGAMAYGTVHEFRGTGALDNGTGGFTGLGVVKGLIPFVATHWCQPEPVK